MKRSQLISQITNEQDPLVRKALLLKTAHGRKRYQEFCAEGERTCQTISTVISPTHWFVTKEKVELVLQLQTEARLYVVSEKLMQKLCSTSSASGVLGIFKIPQHSTLEAPGVVLDGVSDPGNAGTLIRTAAAFGFRSIIAIGGVDLWNSKVIQASAGTIAHIKVFQLDWQAFNTLRNKQKLVALSAHAKTEISREAVAGGFLLLGNEAHGITPEHEADAEQHVKIPMKQTTESLNVAVAGSIALFLASQID